MKVTLGALRAHFGHTRVTLGLLWSPFGVHFGMRGDFGWHLGQLWGHFYHMRVPLGPLWRHFGSTLGPLWVYSSASVSLYDHFGIIVESLWVYEGRFSKNIHFSNRF